MLSDPCYINTLKLDFFYIGLQNSKTEKLKYTNERKHWESFE